MPLKTELLKFLSNSEGNPQSWDDLSDIEQDTAKASGAFCALLIPFTIAASIWATTDELSHSSEHCRAIEQPASVHQTPCHSHKRSPTGLGL